MQGGKGKERMKKEIMREGHPRDNVLPHIPPFGYVAERQAGRCCVKMQ
jgi:hypothetical protein